VVNGKIDREVFGGPLASTLEELEAQTAALFFTEWLVEKKQLTRKYPEYDEIWKDGLLDVILIYGKVAVGTTGESDSGIRTRNDFIATMRAELPNAQVTPARTPARAGIQFPDVTIESTLVDGKKVRLTSLLVDNLADAGPAFQARYKELSRKADVIVYHGHSDLGKNVRALSRMGQSERGKYQILSLEGCDTFAYIDGELLRARAELNPDDPKGTKYLDIIANSWPPTYWESGVINTTNMIRDLMKVDAPVKYETMLGRFNQSGYPVVTGEEDNAYHP
jgi:hypothetical protein